MQKDNLLKTGDKRGIIFHIIINSTIVALEIVGLIYCIVKYGGSLFVAYTNDSNILSLFACLVYSIFLIRKISGKGEIPEWVIALKYIAACCLTITFLVVLSIIIPEAGNASVVQSYLLSEDMLYYHLLCPVLVTLSFLTLGNDRALKRSVIHFAMIPTFLYGFILIILNLTKVVSGPYFFLQVYEQPWYVSVLWCVGIICIAYFVCFFIWFVKKKLVQRHVKKSVERSA